VTFRINARDAIVHAEGSCEPYAGVAIVPLLSERWLGQVIWQFIADEEIRAVLAALLARARGGHSVRLTARSTSRTRPRAATIEIDPMPMGDVEFRCRLTSAVAASPVLPCPLDHLRVCAWCYRADRGGWRAIEDVVASEHLLEWSSFPVITHGICDSCLAKAMDQLEPPAAG
jgi:predicted Fe-S protein YdhL (DUF1289 family)